MCQILYTLLDFIYFRRTRIKKKKMSKTTKKWFSDHRIKLLTWPSQYPDLNPFKKLQVELSRRVHIRRPRILEDLERILY